MASGAGQAQDGRTHGALEMALSCFLSLLASWVPLMEGGNPGGAGGGPAASPTQAQAGLGQTSVLMPTWGLGGRALQVQVWGLLEKQSLGLAEEDVGDWCSVPYWALCLFIYLGL